MTHLPASLTVYRIDPKTNLFLFLEDLKPDDDGQFHVPGNCVRIAPPEKTEGTWPKWTSDVLLTNHSFGQPDTGSWSNVDDYRKIDLFLTADGSKYSLDSDHQVDEQTVSFCGYGELPAWLTKVERPSQFYDWDGTAWIADQVAIDAHEQTMERAWRDGEIASHTWLRDRHSDEILQELPTTLTEAQHTELLTYIQLLRDWPAHADFPDTANRPEKPSWL